MLLIDVCSFELSVCVTLGVATSFLLYMFIFSAIIIYCVLLFHLLYKNVTYQL